MQQIAGTSSHFGQMSLRDLFRFAQGVIPVENGMLKETLLKIGLHLSKRLFKEIPPDLSSKNSQPQSGAQLQTVKGCEGKTSFDFFHIFSDNLGLLFADVKRHEQTRIRVNHQSLPSLISKTELPGSVFPPEISLSFFIRASISHKGRLRFLAGATGTNLAMTSPRLVISTSCPELIQAET